MKEVLKMTDEKMLKFLKGLIRNKHKADMHSFIINIPDGRAVVESAENGITVTEYYENETLEWSGTPEEALLKLKEIEADFESIEM